MTGIIVFLFFLLMTIPYHITGDFTTRTVMPYIMILLFLPRVALLCGKGRLPVQELIHFCFFLVIPITGTLASWDEISLANRLSGCDNVIRVVVLLYIGYTALRWSRMARYLAWLSIVEGIISVLQFFSVDFYKWFIEVTTLGVNPVAASCINMGRSIGTFNSPADAASFFLLALSIFLMVCLRGEDGKETPLMLAASVIAFAGGLTTLARTFVYGIPLLFTMLFLTCVSSHKYRWKTMIAICMVFALLAAGVLLFFPSKRLTYLIETKSRGLGKRWEGSDSVVLSFIRIIDYRMLIHGMGFFGSSGGNLFNGVFIGDVEYIVSLFQFGLVGMLLFYSFPIMIYKKVPDRDLILPFLCLLYVLGFGHVSFYASASSDFAWLLMGSMMHRSEQGLTKKEYGKGVGGKHGLSYKPIFSHP